MSETDPLGIHTSLIERVQASVDDLGSFNPVRHEAPVLNARRPNEMAARFLLLAANGGLEIEEVKSAEYEVAEDLRGFTILVEGRVTHITKDATSEEFDGWYVAEEYHGGNPFLLLTPDRVFKHDQNLSGQEELLLRSLQRE